MRYLAILLGGLLLAGCSTTKKPFYAKNTLTPTAQKDTAKEPIHTLYLVGDAGDKKGEEDNYVLKALQVGLEREGKKSSLVYLGDQLYPSGMPDQKSEARESAETILNEQLDIIQDFQGSTYFIPGEKDWLNGKEGGLKALKRQQAYIEGYYEKAKAHMYPGDGCGDPKVVKITKDLVFVFLDTQWWLQRWADEPAMNEGCELQSRHDLLRRITEILTHHKNDEVVLFMHHPIQSNGVYGSHFSVKDHIFPFKESHNVSAPLPIIGSFVALFRSINGTRQDLVNEQYKALTQGIDQIANRLGVYTLFASAHDNGLQHFDRQKRQYIVSGSGSRTTRTVKADGASFTQQARGFCKVTFYGDFEMWLEVYVVAGPNEKASIVYAKQLRAPRPGAVEAEVVYPPVSVADTVIAASEEFMAGPVKRFFLGSQYRKMWGTALTVPIIDLEKTYGGLVPIKKGGGMSSNSLRMEAPNGKQYILRSIKKDYTKLVPPGFVNLKLLNLLKDQNSASHPYGALVCQPSPKPQASIIPIPNWSISATSAASAITTASSPRNCICWRSARRAIGVMQHSLGILRRSSDIAICSKTSEKKKITLLIKHGC